MGIIKKNKRGVSLAELIAAIVIVGIASTFITTMVITSYRGQLRAQKYILAKEMAKTYDSMLARDIIKSNLQGISDSALVNSDDPTDKYVTVTKELLQAMVKINDTDYGQVYDCLWSDNVNEHFRLNNTTFDHNNVTIRIYVVSKNFGYFKTEVSVKYHGDRQVTYSGTHFKE